MVTIAIIIILTSVLLVSLSGSRVKARDATRISDLSQIQFALALFYDRCGQYPSSLNILDSGISTQPCPGSVNLGSFISQIPSYPTPPAGSYDYATALSGSLPINYVLHVTLEASNPAVVKGLNDPLPSGITASFICSNAANSVNYCITYH